MFAVLGTAASDLEEQWMQIGGYKYPQSNFVRKIHERGVAEGEARGRAEGEVRALLAVLAARGLRVTDEQRAEIEACRDLDQLERWLTRVVACAAVEELFAE